MRRQAEHDDRYLRIAELAEQRDTREAELASVEAELRRLIYDDDTQD
jgi:hypothetical protein